MVNKIRLFSADGVIHQAPKQGAKQKEQNFDDANKKKEICLNCKREKCCGTQKCFKKRVNEQSEHKLREIDAESEKLYGHYRKL